MNTVGIVGLLVWPRLEGVVHPASRRGLQQSPEDLLAGEVMAVAYSGFREGQHPDRGDGAVNPSAEEILEDLRSWSRRDSS